MTVLLAAAKEAVHDAREKAAEGVLPRLLPETTKVLAGAIQVAIAQDELPRAVERTSETHKEISSSDVALLVQQMRIGAETVCTESFRLMNRLGFRAAALAVIAVTGTSSVLPFIARLLRPLLCRCTG